MDSVACIIAQKIKALRTSSEMSQSAVADRLGVSLRTYQGWEKEYNSTVENLWGLCRLFRVDLSRFLESVETRPTATARTVPADTEAGPAEPALDGFKYEICDRAFSGESAEELHEWARKTHALTEPQDSPEDFVDNCVRDIYHGDRTYLRRRQCSRAPEWERRLAERFALPEQNCIVYDSGRIHSQFLREFLLAPGGAEWLIRWSSEKPGLRLGVSNGFTLSKILDAVPRGSVRNMSLFPLNFTHNQVDFPISASSLISSFMYRNYGYNVNTDTLTEEQVYGSFIVSDAAVLGIGSFNKEGHYERMIRAVLGQSALDEVRRIRIAGDLNYHLLMNDGSPADLPYIVSDIGSFGTKSLVKAVSLRALREKAERGCRVVLCASGAHKAAVLKTALEGGYANHILTDTSIAPLLL